MFCQYIAEAVAKFEQSTAVPSVEVVLQWRRKLDGDLKEMFTTALHDIQQESENQCRTLMRELCGE